MVKMTLEKYKEEKEKLDKINKDLKNDNTIKNKSRNEFLKEVRERAIDA